MKNLFITLLVGIGIYGYLQNSHNVISSVTEKGIQGNQVITEAYQNQLSGIQVKGSGKVSRILRDDNKGSRHQKFILRISTGQKLLVAHNIDLAPKIKGLKNGDLVQFSGEYEWNSKGGVIHWTHHDPGGTHVGGWLKHHGRKYE